MFLIRYIERKWFKRRSVYYLVIGNANVHAVALPEGFNVEVKVSQKEEHSKFTFEIRDAIQKSVCASTNVVINNIDESLWHDNYPLKNKEGLIYSSFVDPHHRGRSFYVLLLNFIDSYFHEGKICSIKKLVAIVEENNVASKKSHEKSGYMVFEKNYLIKFFGKNIFSIYSKPLRGYFVYKKCNSF